MENNLVVVVLPGGVLQSWFPMDEQQQQQEEEPFRRCFEEALLRQTWTIHGVSTLFNLRVDSVDLKNYGKRVREHVAVRLSRENVAYDSKFFLLEETDSLAIKITVHAKRDDARKTRIYEGILLSWSNGRREEASRVEDKDGSSRRLPLLLSRGTRGCTNAVHEALGGMFDCTVTALVAKQNDLMRLLSLLISQSAPEEEEEETEKEISLEYTVPGLPASDAITVKFSLSCLRKLRRPEGGESSEESRTREVDKFERALHAQMLGTAGLRLGLCTLHKIGFPGFYLTGNRVKATSIGSMRLALSYFDTKALRAACPHR